MGIELAMSDVAKRHTGKYEGGAKQSSEAKRDKEQAMQQGSKAAKPQHVCPASLTDSGRDIERESARER
jgi:hypothetical protein